MKTFLLSSLTIAALGASSVFAAQNANTTSKSAGPAANAKTTAIKRPTSGGSTMTSGGAIVGGTARNASSKKSVSSKRQPRKVRKHAKKS